MSSAERFPWPRVSWYWGDERFVPYDHPDSNYRMTREAMLSKAPVPPENIHPVPADGTPDDAAARYEQTLQDGLWRDGCSIRRGRCSTSPCSASAPTAIPPRCCRASRCWRSASAGSPRSSHGRPEVRITMTYPVIESSRRVAFLVAGKEKAPIFATIRAGRQPGAGRARPAGGRAHLVCRSRRRGRRRSLRPRPGYSGGDGATNIDA